MKKTIYFLTMILALALMSTSCEKDEPIIEDQITVEDLLGDWNFVSLEFNGNIYETPDELWELNETYDLVALDFNFTPTQVTYSTIYVNARQESPFIRTYDYTFNDLIINCQDQIKFQVVNAETFDGTLLKLKLYDCIQGGAIINGIYNLER